MDPTFDQLWINFGLTLDQLRTNFEPALDLHSLHFPLVLLERGVVRKQHPEREYKSWRPAAAPPHYYTERFLGSVV